MAASSPLATVLQNPAIWRGGDCAPEPAAISTGLALLDAVLPGGGWPSSALTEIVLAREGIGELTLTLPALARLQAQRRAIVWIAPPHVPYAPALVAAGLDLERLMIVRCASTSDQLWAFEQALRAPECGAAFAWLATSDERMLRRLQIAARDGGTWGVLWRRPGEHAIASAAPLRLALAPHEGGLAIKVLKRRGGDLAHPVIVDVHASRPEPRRSLDSRTSAGAGRPPRARRHIAQ
ncbi:MAG: translesion DNA synthesis-associated protein ImuA [Pseudomonadota bacterium]|nr:translesion DNA synthesis-associated protein ImuA [Pseudomonadota bacterium]